MFFYNSLEIRMDYAQKRVYSQPDGQYAISRCICADFDDERTLGGKEPWEGFTSGEVFISVYAKNYTATSFNFFITDVYGQDVSKTTTKNELAPRLSVDTQEYDVSTGEKVQQFVQKLVEKYVENYVKSCYNFRV